jgi:sulfide:quinone oxidoreductase
MAVAEPFSAEPAERHDLVGALAQLGASFVMGALTRVESDDHSIELAGGRRVSYDLLVLAIGAKARPAYGRGETFWAGRSDLEIDRLLDEARSSASHALTFVAPPGCTWPLPLYELALMTRRRSEERGPYGVLLRLITAEGAPLGAFGPVASDAVAGLLRARAIDVITGANVIEEPAGLRIVPGGDLLEEGPMIALPTIVGPAVLGLPANDGGFVPIDLHARVRGIEDVYAAGDGTDFPIKQGGIATQQADAAAEHIAARLGASLEPAPFDPVLRGQLITGGESLHLKHELAGGRGEGRASLDYLWWPPGKVAGRYLAPWLAGTTPDEGLEPPSRPLEVEVALPHEWHGEPLGLQG